MSVEIKKDVRAVEFNGDKFKLDISQEQEYDVENVIAMVLQWQEHKAAMINFLKIDRLVAQKEMEKHLRVQAKNEIEAQFTRAQNELDQIGKALDIWEAKLKEWKEKNIEKYDELEYKAKQSISKTKKDLIKN